MGVLSTFDIILNLELHWNSLFAIFYSWTVGFHCFYDDDDDDDGDSLLNATLARLLLNYSGGSYIPY